MSAMRLHERKKSKLGGERRKWRLSMRVTPRGMTWPRTGTAKQAKEEQIPRCARDDKLGGGLVERSGCRSGRKSRKFRSSVPGRLPCPVGCHSQRSEG